MPYRSIPTAAILAAGMVAGSALGVAGHDRAADEPMPAVTPDEPMPAVTPDTLASGGVRVIDIAVDRLPPTEDWPFAAVYFTQDGARLEDIRVAPGETIVFRIDTPAEYTHNFYIGLDEELAEPASVTDIGIPDWVSGVRELEWTVPEDITGLKFGCTFPGHYPTMQGTFSISAGTE